MLERRAEYSRAWLLTNISLLLNRFPLIYPICEQPTHASRKLISKQQTYRKINLRLISRFLLYFHNWAQLSSFSFLFFTNSQVHKFTHATVEYFFWMNTFQFHLFNELEKWSLFGKKKYFLRSHIILASWIIRYFKKIRISSKNLQNRFSVGSKFA